MSPTTVQFTSMDKTQSLIRQIAVSVRPTHFMIFNTYEKTIQSHVHSNDSTCIMTGAQCTSILFRSTITKQCTASKYLYWNNT